LGQEDLVNKPAPLSGETPLFKALVSGDTGTARFLIEHKADLQATSTIGETMIHAFAKGGEPGPFLDRLVQAGLDINAKALVTNDTPLHIALREGHDDVAQQLIKNGADLTIVNSKGETALHLLMANRSIARDSPETFKTLRDHIVEDLGGAMVKLGTGETPAHIIFKYSNQYARTPLDHPEWNLDFGALDSQGNTLLHAAAVSSNSELLLEMLARGINPAPQNSDGETFLHIAARYVESWETVSIARDWGELMNTKDRWGQTPIDIATKTQGYPISAHFRQILANVDEYQSDIAISGSFSFIPSSSEALEKWRNLKFLSHTWELKGKVQVGAFHEHLEGAFTAMHIPYIRQGIASLWTSHPDLMSSHQGHVLANLLDNAIEKSFWDGPKLPTSLVNDRLILTELQAGGTGLIHTGFYGHAIEIAFHKGYLLVCNRGAGTNKPIEAYKIDPSLLTNDVLNEFSFKEVGDYRTELPQVIAKLQGEKDAVCQSLEELDPLRKFQVVGNCSFESVETALYGVLAVDELLESGGDPYSNQLAIASTFEVFQAFSNNLRLNALEAYLELYSLNPERTDFPMAHRMILDLFGQQLQELEQESGQQLADELVGSAITSKPALPDAATNLFDRLYHCRYVMHNTNTAAQKCLENYLGMPQWRAEMEERFGELKGRYHRLYGADPALLSINSAAQRIGFQRSQSQDSNSR
jgi:ankyrin repeat protein